MKILSKVPELPTDREKSVTSDEMPVGDFLIEGHSASYEEDGQIKNVIHLREKNGEKVFQVFWGEGRGRNSRTWRNRSTSPIFLQGENVGRHEADAPFRFKSKKIRTKMATRSNPANESLGVEKF